MKKTLKKRIKSKKCLTDVFKSANISPHTAPAAVAQG